MKSTFSNLAVAMNLLLLISVQFGTATPSSYTPLAYFVGVYEEGYIRRYFRMGQHRTLVFNGAYNEPERHEITNVTVRIMGYDPNFPAMEAILRYALLENSTSSVYFEALQGTTLPWIFSPTNFTLAPGEYLDFRYQPVNNNSLWVYDEAYMQASLANLSGIVWGWRGYPANPRSDSETPTDGAPWFKYFFWGSVFSAISSGAVLIWCAQKKRRMDPKRQMAQRQRDLEKAEKQHQRRRGH